MSAYGVKSCWNHDKSIVVYSGDLCPFCAMIQKKDKIIVELTEKVDDLKGELSQEGEK